MSLTVFAENLRGPIAGIVNISDSAEVPTVELKLDELAAFMLDFQNPFLLAVELRIEIPRNLQTYRNSFALYLYKNISPLPRLDENSYQGNQMIMHILPSQNTLSLKIPLIENHGLIKDATSVVTSPIEMSSFPLVLTLLPIMKGIPDLVYNQSLIVQALPIYKDQGGLNLHIDPQEEQNILLFIDGEEYPVGKDLYILSSGLHHLRISSPLGGSSEYSLEIERGQILELNHKIELRPALVTLELPPGVNCEIDGVIVNPGMLELQPGDHQINYIINPQWSVSEEFAIRAGEELQLQLNMEVLLNHR
ncbi:MAG: hypothetical protein PF447_03685 [Spirochaetaceae bacterium]|nr:hypothetical protein [Spirochaetaceae bacterium]